jgi:hypothetical protein
MANSIFGTNKSTLGRNPYYSRFTDFEKTSNNYNLIGFTPGLALQAAELNELQDNQIKNDTLSNTLWANWMPYLLTRSTNFITSQAIDSVFWDGTIPISPDLVEYGGRFTFNIGWYYYRHTSGLRYWIHLNEPIALVQDISVNGYVRVNSNFTDVFSSNDSRLYDNSSGSINNTSPGSYRINMEITSFDFVSSTPENYILRFYNTTETSKILWGNNIDTGFN